MNTSPLARAGVEPPVPQLRSPAGGWPRLAKYVALARMSAANQIAYAGEVLLRSIFLVLIMFIFTQLWTLTYRTLGTGQLGSYSLAQMLWYFAFAEAIITSAPGLRSKVDAEVKSGDLAYRLNKPYHYILYLAADYAGERAVRFTLNLLVASAMALLLVGPIPFSVAGVAATALVLVGAIALDFLLQAAVALLAFWVEDTWAFDFIMRRLTLLLGGVMIPLDVFPEPLSSIVRALPFSAIIYGPARLWVAPSAAFFAETLLRLGVALLVGTAVVLLLFRAGQRNVTVNGG